jgi:hypothetical protein
VDSIDRLAKVGLDRRSAHLEQALQHALVPRNCLGVRKAARVETSARESRMCDEVCINSPYGRLEG